MKRSEEEIKEAIDAICTGHNDCPCTPIRVAVQELLTLRRRMDREGLGKKIYEVTLKIDPTKADELWDIAETERFREERRKEADAIIKYLEGKDGE